MKHAAVAAEAVRRQLHNALVDLRGNVRCSWKPVRGAPALMLRRSSTRDGGTAIGAAVRGLDLSRNTTTAHSRVHRYEVRPHCSNSCFKAFDGVCDEGRPPTITLVGPDGMRQRRWTQGLRAMEVSELLCDLGTACSDCGPWVGTVPDSWCLIVMTCYDISVPGGLNGGSTQPRRQGHQVPPCGPWGLSSTPRAEGRLPRVVQLPRVYVRRPPKGLPLGGRLQHQPVGGSQQGGGSEALEAEGSCGSV
ncbi:hypothetical protein Vafri_4544 [Volvox africanus]|uniref:Uncharacterized protein n=1 Tax=Volvox africanus TaxID=51714 RepID=A0A8J4AY53_9CHLO|nr:hypothetical protein Vafri_4544 [Volvox africanus]